MPDLTGKVALITGSSAGIGAATAVLLAKLGAQVIITGRNAGNLEKVAQQCKSANPKCPAFAVPADLAKEEDIDNLIKKTVEKFGKLDILVNNAGVWAPGTLEDTTLEQFDWMMGTNMRAVLQLTQLCVPHLAKTKGCIVNVSSIAGIRSFVGNLAYSVSKAALDQFTKISALELAPKHIRVNSVNPGFIRTDIFGKAGMNDKTVEALLNQEAPKHPLGRVGEGEDVAEAIAFLASNKADFITGIAMSVDGGRHAVTQ